MSHTIEELLAMPRRELDVLAAKYRGYTLIQTTLNRDGRPRFHVQHPGKVKYPMSMYGFDSGSEEIRPHVVEASGYKTFEDYLSYHAPRYSQSSTAAMELADSMPELITAWNDGALLLTLTTLQHDAIKITGEKPSVALPLAITCAYVLWKQSQTTGEKEQDE